MPCFTMRSAPPSRKDYAVWLEMGYLGTWERYVSAKASSGYDHGIMCGCSGTSCADCSCIGEYQCDYPVGHGKTCDRRMCGDHAHEVASDIHYCDGHHEEWERFKAGGELEAELENVVSIFGNDDEA